MPIKFHHFNLNMEHKKSKNIHQIMRGLHRDVGYFIIGLIIIYTLSGIVFIYRDRDFLKHETRIEKTVAPGIAASDLGETLKIKNFKATKTEGEIVYFKEGTYNAATGAASYSVKELPLVLKKFGDIHKANSKSPVHWITTIFGVLLLFLAISALWMFKRGTKLFSRGLILTAAGILFCIVLFFL
jgi:hypothetical protein